VRPARKVPNSEPVFPKRSAMHNVARVAKYDQSYAIGTLDRNRFCDTDIIK